MCKPGTQGIWRKESPQQGDVFGKGERGNRPQDVFAVLVIHRAGKMLQAARFRAAEVRYRPSDTGHACVSVLVLATVITGPGGWSRIWWGIFT